MQTRILNLHDALKLSIILGKYIKESPDLDANITDFFDSLFDKFSPNDFKKCIEIFTGEPLIQDLGGEVLLKIFFEGLQKNKVMTLLKTSKDIGFI